MNRARLFVVSMATAVVASVMTFSAVVAQAAYTPGPTPDFGGITGEASNQLGSAPGLVTGLAGPVMLIVMTIAGFFLVLRVVRRVVK